MKTQKSNADEILRLINELSADAEHTDEESRAALRDAGIDPENLVLAVRGNIRTVLSPSRATRFSWEAIKTCALAVAAASAALFVVAFHINYQSSIEAQ